MGKKKKGKGDRTIWLNPGWLPFSYGFCPSAKAWEKLRKRYGVIEGYPKEDGRTTVYECAETGGLAIIITINKDNLSPQLRLSDFVGLVVHESTHVWQAAQQYIGENNPSPELEAYSMQAIASEILDAVFESWGIAADGWENFLKNHGDARKNDLP